jgi:membrane dipeptidase
MKWIPLLLMATTTMAQTSNKLHQKAILVDTHNDFPSAAINKGVSLDMSLKGKTHSDLDRLQQGGVDVQIFSIWCDGDRKEPYAWANREIDSVHAWAKRNPQRMMLVGNPKELDQAIKQKKLATMMGVEGGHMIEDDLGKLESFYNRGVRYMTLTWNNSTSWATSALDETKTGFSGKKGLTDFGKDVVKKMNALGMLVDLSHVGEQTFYDAMAITTKPVLVSHSCVHALCPIFRNLKDDQIKAIGKNGGVIHLNFFSGFVDSNFMPRYNAFLTRRKSELDSLVAANPQIDKDYLEMQLLEKYKEETLALRPTLDQLMDHMDYIVKLIGIEHVGLGSDFDGISSAPQGLDGVENFPLITEAMVKRGYSKKEIQKVLGGNFIRLFKAVQP